MGFVQNFQRVGDYLEVAKKEMKLFESRFPHPFLVVVEIAGLDGEEDTDDFFTRTRTGVELDAMMDIVQGHKLDPGALIFPVEKRKGANPYSGLITIGRASNCDIVLNINGVSKFHAYLAASLTEQGEFLAGDGNSKNGTLINGQKLNKKMRYPIKNGDRISLSAVVELRYFTTVGLWQILQR